MIFWNPSQKCLLAQYLCLSQNPIFEMGSRKSMGIVRVVSKVRRHIHRQDLACQDFLNS